MSQLLVLMQEQLPLLRGLRNTVHTGRTVVRTIHQPIFDIFEAFDELVLMKRGGQLIYSGPIRHDSHKLIEYFEAKLYFGKRIKHTTPCRKRPLFPTQYSQSSWVQFKSFVRKQCSSNLVRYLFTFACAIMIGTVFWKVGTKRESKTDLTMITIIGAMYASVMFVGINNCP